MRMKKNIVISIRDLNKTYANGYQALKDINLDVYEGEVFALLGPNGAGKTTLIGSVCGTVIPSSGTIDICGHNNIKAFREARKCVGLSPQELHVELFESVWNACTFSRALFGKPRNDAFLEDLLKRLSLWEKKDDQIRTLSGGMKRRVLIAKALAHEPKVLFLDEPSAGVDVELRKTLWQQVEDLRKTGVTIFLTTHYIEEAERMADRVGIINGGKLILTEAKSKLMTQMSNKQLIFEFSATFEALPTPLQALDAQLSADQKSIILNYDQESASEMIAKMISLFGELGLAPVDIHVHKRNLEDIFVEMVVLK